MMAKCVVVPYWGRAIEDLRGREFWYAMQVLIEWVPAGGGTH